MNQTETKIEKPVVKSKNVMNARKSNSVMLNPY